MSRSRPPPCQQSLSFIEGRTGVHGSLDESPNHTHWPAVAGRTGDPSQLLKWIVLVLACYIKSNHPVTSHFSLNILPLFKHDDFRCDPLRFIRLTAQITVPECDLFNQSSWSWQSIAFLNSLAFKYSPVESRPGKGWSFLKWYYSYSSELLLWCRAHNR